MSKKIIITGGRGFVGSALYSFFSARGYEPHVPSRAEFSIGTPIDLSMFDGAPQALVHCAWEMGGSKNVENALQLQKICHEKGVYFIFISSMAAHEEAHSIYGLTKFAVEKHLDQLRDCIIKPGTIIGRGGLFAKILKLARKLPVLPVFYAKTARLQTIYIDDVCRAIVNAVEKNAYGTFVIAHETSISITEFYATIARLSGKNPKLVSVPGDLALVATRLCEAIGLRLPISSDNLLGLKYARHFDTRASCQALDIEPKSFDASGGTFQ